MPPLRPASSARCRSARAAARRRGGDGPDRQHVPAARTGTRKLDCSAPGAVHVGGYPGPGCPVGGCTLVDAVVNGSIPLAVFNQALARMLYQEQRFGMLGCDRTAASRRCAPTPAASAPTARAPRRCRTGSTSGTPCSAPRTVTRPWSRSTPRRARPCSRTTAPGCRSGRPTWRAGLLVTGAGANHTIADPTGEAARASSTATRSTRCSSCAISAGRPARSPTRPPSTPPARRSRERARDRQQHPADGRDGRPEPHVGPRRAGGRQIDRLHDHVRQRPARAGQLHVERLRLRPDGRHLYLRAPAERRCRAGQRDLLAGRDGTHARQRVAGVLQRRQRAERRQHQHPGHTDHRRLHRGRADQPAVRGRRAQRGLPRRHGHVQQRHRRALAACVWPTRATTATSATRQPPRWARRMAIVFLSDTNAVFNDPGASATIPTPTARTRHDLGGHPISPAQINLVNAVAARNPNTVVVLNTTNPVLMPFLDNVKSVLKMWFSGQEGGTSTARAAARPREPERALLDDVAEERHRHDLGPSTSRPAAVPGLTQVRTRSGSTAIGGCAVIPACGAALPEPPRAAPIETEGIYTGYRYFDKLGIPPQFPFGYGLSYTTFGYSDLKRHAARRDGTVDVGFDVTNTGSRAAPRPRRSTSARTRDHPASSRRCASLRGFERVELAPGRTKHLTIHLDARSFQYWDRSASPGSRTRVRAPSGSATPTPPAVSRSRARSASRSARPTATATTTATATATATTRQGTGTGTGRSRALTGTASKPTTADRRLNAPVSPAQRSARHARRHAAAFGRVRAPNSRSATRLLRTNSASPGRDRRALTASRL